MAAAALPVIHSRPGAWIDAGRAAAARADPSAARLTQIPDFGRRKGCRIMAEGQPVRHCLGSDPRTEFRQRRREQGQVLPACLRRQVDVSCRWYRGLLRNGGKGTDDDIAHPMPVQHGDYGGSVQFGFTGSLMLAHATSSAGDAWRHA
jgi:hypothetical protein